MISFLNTPLFSGSLLRAKVKEIKVKGVLSLFAALLAVAPVNAAIDVYDFQDPAKEAQFQALIEELRCPKCQNQNVADSDAMIAKDMKERVYEWVQEGRSSDDITAELVDRYGDFVTYRPPLKRSTLLLWGGPPLVLIIALIIIVWRVRRKVVLLERREHQEKSRARDEEVAVLLDEIKQHGER